MGFLDRIIDQLQATITGKRSRRTREDDIRPASEDPLGDPADLEQPQRGRGRGRVQADVRPASEDPLGDPADLEDDDRRRR